MWKSKEEMQMPASIAGAMCWASSPFPSTTLGSRCFETTDTCNSNCMGTTGEGQLCVIATPGMLEMRTLGWKQSRVSHLLVPASNLCKPARSASMLYTILCDVHGRPHCSLSQPLC